CALPIYINATPYAFYKILRLAHPHQIAGFILRHLWSQVIQNPQHVFFGLSNRQASDGVAIKTDVDQPGQRFAAQLFMHPPLYYPEQRRGTVTMSHLGTLSPA